MTKSFILLIILVLCPAFTFAENYDFLNFSSDGRKLQPVPSGHIPGKDNGPGRGTHNAGEECGACHRPGGKASVVFTASGTLYEDRAGRKPLKEGEVILQDIDGNVISMTSNEVGNFWTYAPIASNPYAVISHGGMTEPLYYTDETGFQCQTHGYYSSYRRFYRPGFKDELQHASLLYGDKGCIMGRRKKHTFVLSFDAVKF
ncbi:hypothetical protein HY745_00605 [Candidatus Desantisbacteria bacterium]|nr:hypothetical protein [Candidatus Desantisbacteria bacterium]